MPNQRNQTEEKRNAIGDRAGPETTGRYLTADERETVILLSDASDTAEIYTHQRRMITKLKKCGAAKLVEEGVHSGCAFARFELPARRLSFRSGTAKRVLSAEQKAAQADRLAKMRRSRAETAA
jgi:hypothetical protein